MNPSHTVYLLMAEFGSAAVPLDAVAKKYFGLEIPQAKVKAKRQQLPVPVYRTSDSQKAPWLISVVDLADYLDSQREKAKIDWVRLQ